MILVTGGAGFIGSNFILDSLLPKTGLETPISSKESAAQNKKPGIVNLDKLTYAGNPSNLKELEAADKAGMKTIQIRREDNMQVWKQSAADFSEIVLI